MPSKTGFVDNLGSEGSAHWQMLETIRLFACGYGEAAAPTFVGTGTGTLGQVGTHPASVTETLTITCTDATTAGAELWSVSGSVTGALAAATTGVAYVSAVLDFLISAGATAFAVGDAFSVAVTQGALSAAGTPWQQMRYDTTLAIRELIMKGVGLSADQEIYVGLRAYEDATNDYYNMSVAGFSGYVPGNSFDTQPKYKESGIPAHNLRIDYWLAVNGQRIAFAMKVGTPVYESGYVGYFYPYALPTQYPYPLVVGGMLAGLAATRFSDTAHAMPYPGTGRQLWRLNVAGVWVGSDCWPWIDVPGGTGGGTPRDTNGSYALYPVVITSASPGVYGELDGVRMISGFSNAVENTLTLGATNYVVIEDVYRTGFTDYYALALA